MKQIYTLKNGKKAIINTKRDKTLIDTLYVGAKDQTSGEDFMVHITQGGVPVFYLLCWSRWEGSIDRVEVLGEKDDLQVRSYIEENFRWLDDVAIKDLEKLGLVFEETA